MNNLLGVCSRLKYGSPKDSHLIVPRACECYLIWKKGVLAAVIKLRIFFKEGFYKGLFEPN